MEHLTTKQIERLQRSIKFWFNQYLKEVVSLDELIESLEGWEESLKGTEARKKANSMASLMNWNIEIEETENDSKNLWFRFYNGDTLATTINDLNKDLNPTTGTRENRELIKYNIFTALKEDSLQINFS